MDLNLLNYTLGRQNWFVAIQATVIFYVLFQPKLLQQIINDKQLFIVIFSRFADGQSIKIIFELNSAFHANLVFVGVT